MWRNSISRAARARSRSAESARGARQGSRNPERWLDIAQCDNITFHMAATITHHHHHPGHAHPPATVVAVDPAPFGAGAARRRGGGGRGAVGRGVLGDGELTMSAALEFRNLTLGYDRHPAVHHLHGPVEAGALIAVVGPNGAGKSTLFKGIVGMLKPLAGGIDLCGAARARHRLSAADRRHRPHLPDRRLRHGRDGAVAARPACSAASAGANATRCAQRSRRSASRGFEERPIGTLSGGQMQRALFARLLLQDARVIVLDEPFNAIDTKTAADLCDLVHALARREAHRDRGAARSRAGQVDVPRGAAAGARAGGVGRDARRADARRTC